MTALLAVADSPSRDQSLITAAENNELEKVEHLIADGASLNAVGKDKCGSSSTALMAAASEGHLEVVRLLLDKGADVNAKTRGGHTALMSAALLSRT